jgi:cell division protein FtsI/penicillin-binding protein 2
MSLKEPSWKKYQAELKREALLRRLIRRIPQYLFLSLCAVITIVSVIYLLPSMATWLRPAALRKPVQPPPVQMEKRQVQALLAENAIDIDFGKEHQVISSAERHYQIVTTIDLSLQRFLAQQVASATKRERYRSKVIGIVAMAPRSGKVLAMVGYRKQHGNPNPCMDSRFPAASIFKIITAAAAIEKRHLSASSVVRYNGRKHTLYRSQLKKGANRYTHRVTFKDAFAQSINPVFGKIGVHYLGMDTLQQYADAFGYNQPIPFDLPLTPIRCIVTDDSYHLAEIASGFNKETELSPLHAALMASVVLNGGHLLSPVLVDKVVDEKGGVPYRSEHKVLRTVISPETCSALRGMMLKTIESGTGRKIFRGFQRDSVLSALNIGGKTGSINNDPRYDWFVGFGEQKKGSGKVVVAAMVAHEKYIGVRAGQYVRKALEHYFQRQTATALK